ncbi:GntR family transcriptional regulator [Porphyromonas cangingivalis]|uniref:DNA-binding transcriptional regulator YhcF, GntR family n=1 Tax=Porphyromonas cangingivalis TaxID=36874 RepID=A0A0A2ERK4_PORCN|nr:GntR family transcriptional regulator [Porphyromonas cangingivalis]KGN81558.1 GntR family transcriptional regulator [Porphyromonas cangingivalis]SJZ78920.1 DNA-binding transcriptional regulator YhcF, GntR family [Porphyromonas cangingivalis]SPY35183.1 Uncharacterized HTH-type transcriptional regulator ydcR [Porphyromonas cangingivalis]VEJ03587.1 Uncharacterized HTH-type transcriptional regulator ydcR [Porphyromonas cangingivalis]
MREQSIFVQISETIKDRILSGEYTADERIPSVRDIAVDMEVNPNTVMKAFELLQRDDLIYNKRGMGYFVAPEAIEAIKVSRRARLRDNLLPSLFREMELLGIDIAEIIEAYNKRPK